MVKTGRIKVRARSVGDQHVRLCFPHPSVRRDILGHSSPTMTGDYTHTSPEAMEKAMELLADYSREKIFSLTAKSRQAG
jgi:integrase